LQSASEVPTDAMQLPDAPVPSHSFEEGRFPPGTSLAERYRIIGLVGQGGMGEVYRASDLKLGQPVALKFLPPATATNQHLKTRFLAEVRIARQVSHPNVCRVYDIGEVDGFTFLSMEYVDGEDLRSLLRRIGRLPGDKAIEIGRKLCAGLAAAHDKGVLHRDLKPANVMINGRGEVLITDFGLAAFAGQISPADIRDGTPAYMAPEQLAGKEVSVQSDLYALGLVLHEIFTGKPVFRDGAERTTPSSLSSLVKDIDPSVERAILRCLELDPRQRPSSALAVAAALPGGDPIAAALAAGETPTPAMVAASDTGGISIRTCWICLAAILTSLAGIVAVNSKLNLSQRIPFSKAPAVLEQKARDMIQTFGYADPPVDAAHGFLYETSLLLATPKIVNGNSPATRKSYATAHRRSSRFGIGKALALWKSGIMPPSSRATKSLSSTLRRGSPEWLPSSWIPKAAYSASTPCLRNSKKHRAPSIRRTGLPCSPLRPSI
jgi:serine/threonine-protein kinase